MRISFILERLQNFSRNKGFSLAELLVVVSIMTLITTALVIQQDRWNNRLALNNQAYDLVLAIRQSQVNGLGVRESPSSIPDRFDLAYGVEINMDTPDRYSLFGDNNKDKKLTSGELLETKSFNRSIVVNRVCSVETCSTSGSLRRVSVTFYRPDPKAEISFLDGSNNVISGLTAPATIYVRSPQGVDVPVRIESNGQISIGI